MKKLIYILIAIVGLLLALFEWLRHPLPATKGTHTISGLSKQVDIYTDKYGVPHVFAKNEQDLFFAAGYIAARDRLFQLSLVSLAVRGGLSSVLGPDYLEKDIYFRTWKIHETAKKLVENMDAQNKIIFENFCKGINFRIDEVYNDPPLEFKLLGFKPSHWDPTTVAGYARMMAHEMSGSWKPEVIFGAVESYFGKEMLKDILPDEQVDIPTIAGGLPTSIIGSLNKVLESEYGVRNLFGDVAADIGSNNWVVSPSRTVTGHPFLANDPHLAFSREKARCGSFARKGWPVTVRDGDTTQLFDPISAATSPKRFRTPYSLSSTLFKLPIILVGKPPAIVGMSTCSSGSMSFNISLPKYDSTAPKITSGFHDPDISCAIILA